MEVYPIYFEPVYRERIWGGERIKKKYKRSIASSKVAESWEIVDREDEMSIVSNGVYQTMSLKELMDQWQVELLGKHQKFQRFPLLIKLIDASDNLSVQVHPCDKTAILFSAEAKNEMWYILEADCNSYVYAGFKPGVILEAFEDALKRNRMLDLLKNVSVQKGDTIFIPGGRIHSIPAGNLIFEVQQNSDTTYRIYDWNRLGKDQKPRELHLEQAMQVLQFKDTENPKMKPRLAYTQNRSECWELIQKAYFQLERIVVSQSWEFSPKMESFQIFFLLKGEAVLKADTNSEKMVYGRTYLIPAAAKTISIEGKAEVLKVSLPLKSPGF